MALSGGKIRTIEQGCGAAAQVSFVVKAAEAASFKWQCTCTHADSTCAVPKTSTSALLQVHHNPDPHLHSFMCTTIHTHICFKLNPHQVIASKLCSSGATNLTVHAVGSSKKELYIGSATQHVTLTAPTAAAAMHIEVSCISTHQRSGAALTISRLVRCLGLPAVKQMRLN